MILDPDIISLIIQEEKAKRLEREAENGCQIPLYIEPPSEEEWVEEKAKDGSQRGVVVIDI